MNFKLQKQKQLEKKDISNIGKWDKEIIGLCRKINSRKEYYTTSSCAGRIVLIKGLDKKSENVFLFKTHKKIKLIQLKKELEKAAENWKGLVYFKQESCILHTACSNMKSAEILLKKARLSGWKRSGIMASGKRIICELMSTEKIEFPAADKGKILTNDKLLRVVVREANKKLSKTRKKIKKLENMI